MTNNEEQWLPIPGYEGTYEVSSLGRVRSLDRVIDLPTRNCTRRLKGRVLKATPNSWGYYTVNLSQNDIQHSYVVHRLVLEAFVGPCPEDMTDARHLNDRKDDNCLENLAWGTRGQNHLDAVRNGTHWGAAKTHCPQGHAYEGDNLIIKSGGGRVCRECERTAKTKYNRRVRAERKALA